MLGDPDSCGIWAPCLTHADGLFYLIYTDVKRYGRTSQAGASGASLRDFHNYLVTSAAHRRRVVRSRVLSTAAASIRRCFTTTTAASICVNMLWDHRPGQNRFAGIVLQEYSAGEQQARSASAR